MQANAVTYPTLSLSVFVYCSLSKLCIDQVCSLWSGTLVYLTSMKVRDTGRNEVVTIQLCV